MLRGAFGENGNPATINSKNVNTFKDSYGNTLLMLAAGCNPARVMATEEKDVREPNSRTALMEFQGWERSGRGTSRAITSALLIRGALPDLKNRRGRTALMYAAAFGYSQIARTLLSHGADVAIKDNNGHTALMYAALNSAHDVADAVAQYAVNWCQTFRQSIHIAMERRDAARGEAELEEFYDSIVDQLNTWVLGKSNGDFAAAETACKHRVPSAADTRSVLAEVVEPFRADDDVVVDAGDGAAAAASAHRRRLLLPRLRTSFAFGHRAVSSRSAVQHYG